jgi:hypothetical protein
MAKTVRVEPEPVPAAPEPTPEKDVKHEPVPATGPAPEPRQHGEVPVPAPKRRQTRRYRAACACGWQFPWKKGLAAHLKNPPPPDGRFECSCGSWYTSARRLRRHINHEEMYALDLAWHKQAVAAADKAEPELRRKAEKHGLVLRRMEDTNRFWLGLPGCECEPEDLRCPHWISSGYCSASTDEFINGYVAEKGEGAAPSAPACADEVERVEIAPAAALTVLTCKAQQKAEGAAASVVS